MFQWLTRVVTRSQPNLETAPVIVQQQRTVGASPRRGVTVTPLQISKAHNRQANRIARASRTANR